MNVFFLCLWPQKYTFFSWLIIIWDHNIVQGSKKRKPNGFTRTRSSKHGIYHSGLKSWKMSSCEWSYLLCWSMDKSRHFEIFCPLCKVFLGYHKWLDFLVFLVIVNKQDKNYIWACFAWSSFSLGWKALFTRLLTSYQVATMRWRIFCVLLLLCSLFLLL